MPWPHRGPAPHAAASPSRSRFKRTDRSRVNPRKGADDAALCLVRPTLDQGKQDPTLSFPSQREACATKAAELGGEIVCDFTDQEAGRRDDRAGWAELLREAKEREARRFDAVVIYATSRLSRDLFHALTYEREMTRAGVEVFYALTAGDQTSPEGRLIRHMFQALDQFEVEKLGREVRRGQTQNTRQGYRNGGRAPYGYRLKHQPHPDPARAKAGDTKSRLVVERDQAPVIAEIFERFLSGAGYKEIANHLNRPGGPPPPSHVDRRRNASGKWAKATIKAMLENPVYTGHLYWNRLDSRAHKQGVGPVTRRSREEWIEADEQHEPLITEEQFERAQAEMKRRSTGHGNRRRRPQKRFYLLRGIVHCATGHNPLRMQGRGRKGEPTYYTCGYRRLLWRPRGRSGRPRQMAVRARGQTDPPDRQLLRHQDLRPEGAGPLPGRKFGPRRLPGDAEQRHPEAGCAPARRNRPQDRAPARRDRGRCRSGRRRRAHPQSQR
ncbi:MAG TPA: recombinase family protein [Solirubrobacterales bacterium]|nr:recombinase family protein [Solirubrobacterales bacterium]